jgi:hypothetical protein
LASLPSIVARVSSRRWAQFGAVNSAGDHKNFATVAMLRHLGPANPAEDFCCTLPDNFTVRLDNAKAPEILDTFHRRKITVRCAFRSTRWPTQRGSGIAG